jgi:hypothetical protein
MKKIKKRLGESKKKRLSLHPLSQAVVLKTRLKREFFRSESREKK